MGGGGGGVGYMNELITFNDSEKYFAKTFILLNTVVSRYIDLEAASRGLASVYHCNFTLDISRIQLSRTKYVSPRKRFLTILPSITLINTNERNTRKTVG